MFTLTEIFTIIVIHFIADFVLQTDKQAKGKSKNWSDLLSHTYIYSKVWFIIGVLILAYKSNLFTNLDFYNPWSLTLFTLITFICHTITDYFTSRLNNRLLPPIVALTFDSDAFGDNEMLAYPKKSSWHNFFVGVSADQILHYVQLFLTYYYLFK